MPDISLEYHGIRGSVDCHHGIQTAIRQGAQNGEIAAEVFRNRIGYPLATQCSAIAARHGNVQPRLVDELKPVGRIADYPLAVPAACQTYARLVPLGSMDSLFFRRIPI